MDATEHNPQMIGMDVTVITSTGPINNMKQGERHTIITEALLPR
jgi:hypothetical protein